MYPGIGFSIPTDKAIKKGEIIQCTFNNSTVYPDTKRNYRIYIPADYDTDKPPCLYVAMDGISYNAPDILDSLISDGDIPPMIGVFITNSRYCL
jgi:enterochelin esterase-like enzyme